MTPWLLDPSRDFLNHGSFGSCPAPVLEAQQRLQRQMELDPVRFLAWELEPLLDEAREALATLLKADAQRLVFVPNATAGVNAVLRSLRFEPGDELLTTNHAYPACRRALDWVASRQGALVTVAQIPFPLESPQQVRDAVLAAITPRTRLAMLDHVTSPTGLVFPVGDLVRPLQQRGVHVLIDGAHAPGMLDLDLEQLGADFYAGNCHKWLCSPKGAGFLYLHPKQVDQVAPPIVSHGKGTRSRHRHPLWDEFDWMGTLDPTPYLSVKDAIRFLESQLPGGLKAVQAHNRDLTLQARDVLCRALNVPPPAPDDMIGSLASVPLPDRQEGQTVGLTDPLVLELYHHGFQVPVFAWPHPPKRVIRVSIQLYNRLDQVERLAAQLLAHLLAALE